MPVFGKATPPKHDPAPAEPELPRLGDPRGEIRQELRLQGICECMNPPQRVACVIVDITGSGAKIEFATTDRIPDAFKVYVSSINVALECRVAWREPTQLGVRHTIKPLA